MTKRFHGKFKLYCWRVALFHNNTTCCFKHRKRHFGFQCKFHEEHVIASYNTNDYTHLEMEQVEEFVTYYASNELHTFANENKTCPRVKRFEGKVTSILEYCIAKFSQNIYVVDYNERGKVPQESTDVLQEEEDENINFEEEECEDEDKNLSLGMPMQPQEDDENDEQLENK